MRCQTWNLGKMISKMVEHKLKRGRERVKEEEKERWIRQKRDIEKWDAGVDMKSVFSCLAAVVCYTHELLFTLSYAI